MNYDEYLLDVAAEECSEIAQRISKALRFSLGEVQPGQALTNAERIVGELVDLKAIVEMLEERGLIDCAPLHDRSLIAAKKAKVEKFSAYSEQPGAMIPRELTNRARWPQQNGRASCRERECQYV